jgi:hypothetical protein
MEIPKSTTFIVVFLAFFYPLLIVFIIYSAGFLAAALGGWKRLAKVYPAEGSFEGMTHSFVSGKMGLANYGLSLVTGANPRGLYLWVIAPLKPSHKPLFIPWDDLRASWFSFLFLKRIRLTFAKVPDVWLMLEERHLLRLLDESGSSKTIEILLRGA